jgi:FMN-dependent NADH-azoreductase
MILGFIGFQDIKTIMVEPTLTDPESKNRTISASKDHAISFAKHF